MNPVSLYFAPSTSKVPINSMDVDLPTQLPLPTKLALTPYRRWMASTPFSVYINCIFLYLNTLPRVALATKDCLTLLNKLAFILDHVLLNSIPQLPNTIRYSNFEMCFSDRILFAHREANKSIFLLNPPKHIRKSYAKA